MTMVELAEAAARLAKALDEIEKSADAATGRHVSGANAKVALGFIREMAMDAIAAYRKSVQP